LIYIEVDSNVEISPCVIFTLVIWEWQFMSFQKDALRNSGVFNFWFKDVNGVIIKEVVDSTFSGSKIFIGVFNNGFNEECIIYENL